MEQRQGGLKQEVDVAGTEWVDMMLVGRFNWKEI